MNNFVIDTPDNFWQIRWLDKYMEGHKGFIAGGCFKNILSGERVKDIDIFFESESDFQEAIDSFNDEKHQKEGWKFKYRNEKVCAFQKEGENVWIEFIESEFGKPKEILRSFDFTVTKMAYYKEPKYEEKEDDYFPLENGEYIPSLGQLNLMAHYMNELNKAFAYVSASPLSSTWYWSSTESSQAVAWYVVFSSGLTGTGNKHIGDMVRAVIDF